MICNNSKIAAILCWEVTSISCSSAFILQNNYHMFFRINKAIIITKHRKNCILLNNNTTQCTFKWVNETKISLFDYSNSFDYIKLFVNSTTRRSFFQIQIQFFFVCKRTEKKFQIYYYCVYWRCFIWMSLLTVR